MKGGIMVEGARLESVYAGDRIVGSKPRLSVTTFYSNILKNIIKSTLLAKIFGKK